MFRLVSKFIFIVAAYGVAAYSLAGCGGLAQDPVMFTVGSLEYTVDAERWSFAQELIPEKACKVSADCADLADWCGQRKCRGECSAGGICQLEAEFVLWNEVQISDYAPDEVFLENSKLEISGAYVDITEDNLAPGPESVFFSMAPGSIVSPDDPDVIPLTSVQIDGLAMRPVELASDFTSSTPLLEDPDNPINVLAEGTIVIQAGKLPPSGTLVLDLSLDAISRPE